MDRSPCPGPSCAARTPLQCCGPPLACSPHPCGPQSRVISLALHFWGKEDKNRREALRGGSRVAICGQRICFKSSSGSRKKETGEAEGGGETRPDPLAARARRRRRRARSSVEEREERGAAGGAGAAASGWRRGRGRGAGEGRRGARQRGRDSRGLATCGCRAGWAAAAAGLSGRPEAARPRRAGARCWWRRGRRLPRADVSR